MTPEKTTNHRTGTGATTVLTDDGPLASDVPGDREGTFEPQVIPSTSAGIPGSPTRSWRATLAA
jgi:putative transposase